MPESAMDFTFAPQKRRSTGGLNRGLFIANVVGAVVYVIRAMPSWAIPQERAAGVYSVTGEPFVWVGAILPIIMSFAILNLVWGIYIYLNRAWQGSYFWLMSALAWLIAAWIDFAHH